MRYVVYAVVISINFAFMNAIQHSSPATHDWWNPMAVGFIAGLAFTDLLDEF